MILHAKEIIRTFLSKIPFSFYSNLLNLNLTIPYYHMISDDAVLHIKHIYPHKKLHQFTDDLDFVLKHFKPIDLMTLLAYIHRGKELPQKSLLMTFDDGFREIHDIVAPILIIKGIPATFFINSSFTDNRNLCYQHKGSLIVDHLIQNNISNTVRHEIDRIFTKNNIKGTSFKSNILTMKYDQRNLVDQIAEILEMDFNHYLQKYQPYLTTSQIQGLLSNGFSIGGHSIDHPLYAALTLKEQVQQTIESVRFVRNTFNLDYGAFAFPHSDSGVSKQYFKQIEKSGLVDISFGTSGMVKDCVPNHFQRFSLENPPWPARNIFSYQCAKQMRRIVNQDNKIIRKQT